MSIETDGIGAFLPDPSFRTRFVGALRRAVLVAGPVGAAIAMWFHPHTGEDVFESLAPVADTFVVAHILLFVSLALVALGLYILTAGFDGPLATVARAGIGVYAFAYLSFVAIVGVAKGLVVREGAALPEGQQGGVAEVAQSIHTDPMLLAVGAIGVLGYLVAVVALAAIYYRAGAPRVPLIFLVGSVIALGVHSGPIAVVGMVGLLVAMVWLGIQWDERPGGTPAP